MAFCIIIKVDLEINSWDSLNDFVIANTDDCIEYFPVPHASLGVSGDYIGLSVLSRKSYAGSIDNIKKAILFFLSKKCTVVELYSSKRLDLGNYSEVVDAFFPK